MVSHKFRDGQVIHGKGVGPTTSIGVAITAIGAEWFFLFYSLTDLGYIPPGAGAIIAVFGMVLVMGFLTAGFYDF